MGGNQNRGKRRGTKLRFDKDKLRKNVVWFNFFIRNFSSSALGVGDKGVTGVKEKCFCFFFTGFVDLVSAGHWLRLEFYNIHSEQFVEKRIYLKFSIFWQISSSSMLEFHYCSLSQWKSWEWFDFFIFGANPCELNQLEVKIDGKTLCPNHKQVIRPAMPYGLIWPGKMWDSRLITQVCNPKGQRKLKSCKCIEFSHF